MGGSYALVPLVDLIEGPVGGDSHRLLATSIPSHASDLFLGAQYNGGGEDDAPRRLLSTSTSTLLAPSCPPADQRLALMLFFNATGGPSWTNNSGWPLIPELSILDESAFAQRVGDLSWQTGTCNVDATMLPDHCCWCVVHT